MGEEKPQKEDKTTPTNKQTKPSKGSGLTISTSDGSNSGATISTYDGGETGAKEKSNIYEDPNTGSTIATGEARKNIAEGGDYQIKTSTSTPLVSQGAGPKRPKTEVDKVIFEKPNLQPWETGAETVKDANIVNQQKEIIKGPRPSKDLATGQDLKYSGDSTTSINKISPSLRRALLGGGMGSVLRRLSGLQPK